LLAFDVALLDFDVALLDFDVALLDFDVVPVPLFDFDFAPAILSIRSRKCKKMQSKLRIVDKSMPVGILKGLDHSPV